MHMYRKDVHNRFNSTFKFYTVITKRRKR